MNLRKKHGITLISLVITIVVLIILASIATYSGMNVINSSKLTAFTAELKIMQAQVNEIYQKYKDDGSVKIDEMTYSGEAILNIGQEITGSIKAQADKVFTELAADPSTGITSQDGYRYWDKEDVIKKLGIEGVEQSFFVNVEKRSVVSYYGFDYENKMYYTLGQVPNNSYNVEYQDKNVGQKPTFDIKVEPLMEQKWRITISNIQFNGYIDKWQVKYQLEGKDYWNTVEDLDFVVNEGGTYKIQIVNGDIASEIQTKYLGYATENLYLYYDGITNAKNNHDNTAAIWKDMSGNNHDGTIIGTPTWQSNKMVLDGVDDYIDTGIKQSSLGQKITIQTIANFEDISAYRGLYGFHQSAPNWFGITSQCANTHVGFTFYCGNEKSCYVIVDKSILLNKETHITITMEGGKGIKVYLDGVLFGETATTENINPRDDYNFMIAKSYPTDNRYFKGTISNFKVYRKVLTEEEIQMNYQLDKIRFHMK